MRSSPRALLVDWPLYALGDEIAVDAVGMYERLEEDLGWMLGQIGLDVEADLPRAKSGFRPRGDPQRLSDESVESIRRRFHREVDAFGYECPPELRARSS